MSSSSSDAAAFPDCLKSAIVNAYTSDNAGVEQHWRDLAQLFINENFLTKDKLLQHKVAIKETISPYYLSEDTKGASLSYHTLWWMKTDDCKAHSQGLKIARKKAQSAVNRGFARLCCKILDNVVRADFVLAMFRFLNTA
jgi:hypothetical protein